MSRLGTVYIAFVFALSGAFTGAAIAFRFLSQGAERLGGVQ